jgi:hypothetical protein
MNTTRHFGRATLWALLAVLTLAGSGAQAATSINFGAYTGVFRVSGPAGYSLSGSGSAAGANLGDLPDGEYFFDSGASIGNAIAASYFTFTISAGQIIAVSNSAAASISVGSTTLVLNNCHITIDPASYAGRYWLSSYSAGGVRWQNQQSFVLIPGLLYSVDNTSLIGYSAFSFVVDGSGNVADVLDANGSPTSVPAGGSGSTLTLQNMLVQIDPTTYVGSYRVGGVDVTAGGKTTITLIPGLLTSITAGAAAVGNFTPVSGMPQTTVANGGLTFLVGPPPPLDSTPPTSTVIPSGTLGLNGWYTSSVTVSLSAADNTGGSGVAATYYRIDSTGSFSLYTGPFMVSGDGTRAVDYYSVDNAGNAETVKPLVLEIDTTPPVVMLSAADGLWHKDDVSIAGSASDGAGSGLANSGDASFTLSTTVPAGTETSSAQTDSRIISDVAGNSTTAGPISGIMVDKKAPTLTITSPAAGATYLLNQPVLAGYTITDGGSGVDTSHSGGPVSSGSPIDTAAVGSKSFTVSAQDNVGNVATQSVSYTVAYAFAALYDQTKAVKSGATIPIKLQITDASGANISASGIVVHAVRVNLTSTNAPGALEDAGNANPDFDFRYDASLGGTGGYIYNLKTTGLGTGTYAVTFSVAGDPTTHTVQFQVR